MEESLDERGKAMLHVTNSGSPVLVEVRTAALCFPETQRRPRGALTAAERATRSPKLSTQSTVTEKLLERYIDSTTISVFKHSLNISFDPKTGIKPLTAQFSNFKKDSGEITSGHISERQRLARQILTMDVRRILNPEAPLAFRSCHESRLHPGLLSLLSECPN